MSKSARWPTYETRFRHKLNMLEPGIAMCRCICVSAALGNIFLLMHLKTIAYIAFGLAGAVLLLLLILLFIEAHQDKVLNEIAARENRDDKHQPHR